MSVKQGLLALLAQQPMYGAQMRTEFEARTVGTWPLNVGQVYTTLGRLERDGLVEAAGAADDEGRIAYRITDAGRRETTQWWTTPVDRSSTPRDELTIKLALAVTIPGVDVLQVTQTQRRATLQHLHDLTRLKHEALRAQDDPDAQSRELAWLLVLENLIFGAEAEVRWLDHVETRLHRLSVSAPSTPSVEPNDEATVTAATPPSVTATATASTTAGARR